MEQINIDLKKVDAEIAIDIKNLKGKIEELIKGVEVKYGESFRLRVIVQQGWINGEKLINHCMFSPTLKDEIEEHRQ